LLPGYKNKKMVWFFNVRTIRYALEREHAKGKNIVDGKDNFLTKIWITSYHTKLCKLKKLLPTDILMPKSVVYIVVALIDLMNAMLESTKMLINIGNYNVVIRPIARILLPT
jgi:hypothetical protein